MYGKIASKVVTLIQQSNPELNDPNLRAISTYGIEIGLSTLVNYALIIAIGAWFRSVLSVIVFSIMFNTLRKYIGGYHCTTYFRCNMTFCAIFTLILTLSKLLSCVMNIIMALMILSFCGYGIWCWGPLENAYKPVTAEQQKHCHTIAKVIFCFDSVFAIICYIWLPYYGIVAILSLLAVVVLLPIGAVAERRRKLYEAEKQNCEGYN